MSPTTLKIKIRLLEHGLNIADLAREFGCLRKELSMTIGLDREYPRLRQKLADRLGIPIDVLFPKASPAKARPQVKARRTA
jgi:lambda repressor-like predicted transcriptional regulator